MDFKKGPDTFMPEMILFRHKCIRPLFSCAARQPLESTTAVQGSQLQSRGLYKMREPDSLAGWLNKLRWRKHRAFDHRTPRQTWNSYLSFR